MCFYQHSEDNISNEDELNAIRAFALRVERHPAEHGQRHHLFLEPLKSHSVELGDEYELGDIFLSRAHGCGRKYVQAGELLLEGRLVASRDNVDIVWQRMLDFIRGQEVKSKNSRSWQKWKFSKNLVSVDCMNYFASFKQRIGEDLIPCLPDMQIYYSGIDEASSLPTFFRQ